MHKPALGLAVGRVRASMVRFRDDERGAMSLVIMFTFLAMILFGGIAIDVMRFETRRVAMQQTLDRAALAAASLTQSRTPQQVVDDYFAKANLGEGLVMVDFEAPVVTALTDAGLRRVTASAKVTSTNFFMGMFSTRDTLEGPSMTEAAQGVSQIEVLLVLDITGSMTGSAGNGKSKIQALREAATEFVTIVKGNDTKDGVSIGVVPYAAQVNIPADLRDEFNVLNLSSWDGIADQGVPNINCVEFPTSSYNQTAYLPSTPIRMAAVADANSGSATTTNYEAPLGPVASTRACTTNAETGSTPWIDAEVNQVLLPTKDPEPVKTKINRLTAQGNTSIAVGMRWATALIDEAARPVYANLLSSEAGMAGRPADNDSIQTRKIIILMTDGEHVTNTHILDAFKSGPSPIWRTTNNRFAIRYSPTGGALTNGTRPGGTSSNTCSGWQLTNFANRQFFVPDLKRNAVPQRSSGDVNEVGTGSTTSAACDPRSWIAQEVNALGQPILRLPIYNSSGAITGHDVATQLDWSEVWRYLRVSWVARQLYMRSGVTGTTNYNTIMNQFRGTYLTSAANMNALLQTNCAIARKDPNAPIAQSPVGQGSGIEIYGIAFAAPVNGQTQINGCSSEPKENYYFNATDGDKLLAAFKAIATDISELRLTQ